MFLKSLEIFGFKSFADRTRIEFADGISALLGPQLIDLATQERRALEVLSEGGLLPPLRLDSPTERERRVG